MMFKMEVSVMIDQGRSLLTFPGLIFPHTVFLLCTKHVFFSAGALLLYAEDLALTTNNIEPQPIQKTARSLEAEDTSLFNTFDDLRSAILSYGAKVSYQ